MNVPTVLKRPPNSTENPLLSTIDFYNYCHRRFREIRSREMFVNQLQSLNEDGLLLPIFRRDGVDFYSSFQLWQLYKVIPRSDRVPTFFGRFQKVLRLLFEIQNFYLPEFRSDRREADLELTRFRG